jgi:pathogenesis-related protein 1
MLTRCGSVGTSAPYKSGQALQTTSASGDLPVLTDMLAQTNAERSLVSDAPLQWSSDLANRAQSWAIQCNFSHNQNRGNSGENIYADSNVSESASDAGIAAETAWAQEKQYYDPSTNTCASGQVCGHYTQLVWSSTTQVGCAVVNCPNGISNTSFGAGTIVVCEYSPPGNYVGQSPY